MTDRAVRQYMAQVRRVLVCAPDSRRRLLARAEALVEDFLQEDPAADYPHLVEAFGPPRDFAQEMLASLDGEEVRTAQRRKTLLRRGLIAAVALALVLTTVFWYMRWQEAQISNRGYTVVMGPAEPMTEEEFDEFIKNAQSVHEGG